MMMMVSYSCRWYIAPLSQTKHTSSVSTSCRSLRGSVYKGKREGKSRKGKPPRQRMGKVKLLRSDAGAIKQSKHKKRVQHWTIKVKKPTYATT